MQSTTRLQSARRIRTALRRYLVPAGFGGGGLWLTGCATLAGAGVVLAVGLLTGAFLGSIQASFAATAHSYEYSDSGLAQWVFNRPQHNSNIDLSRFVGRLPGFYFVIIDLDDKAMLPAEDREPVQYETDVEIDFETNPPTFSGTIREVNGDAEFPITDVYPEIESISLNVFSGASVGQYDIRLTAVLLGVDGERLEYSLIWHAGLSSHGLSLSGDIDVERVLTTADGKQFVNEGLGSVSTAKQ